MKNLPLWPFLALRTIVESVSSEESVTDWGTNPPPRNQRNHWVTSKATFSRRGKKGHQTAASAAFFYFAAFRAGRSAICTTLLFAARFDSIMASP
jgi:hypothetical protein